MATKKNKTQSTIYLAALLILLLLGSLGVTLPENLAKYFSPAEETTLSSTQKHTTNDGPMELGTSTFTLDELKNSQNGWISFSSLDSLGRAHEANALLKPDMINTGSSADSNIRPTGFISGKDPYNHSRGHLIGRQLGGSGNDPRNLVTLYQNPVNTPYMTKYENQIRQALENGETVRYRVTPIYDGNELLCKEVQLSAKSLGKNGSVDFKVVIANEK